MTNFTIDIEKEIAPLVEAIGNMNKRLDAIQSMTTNEAIAYSPAEVAQKLGVSRRVIDTSIKRGEIVARKFGRRVLIPRDSLISWMNKLPLAG